MKHFFMLVSLFLMLTVFSATAFAYKYVNSYTHGDGTYVSGHWRDTSNDGNPYNNANYNGMND